MNKNNYSSSPCTLLAPKCCSHCVSPNLDCSTINCSPLYALYIYGDMGLPQGENAKLLKELLIGSSY